MISQLAILFVLTVLVRIQCDAQGSPLCVENSSPNDCGRMCEPSCTNREPKFCPRIVCTRKTRACRCDSGYLRDGEKCVPPALCKTCPAGQALLACGTLCEGTCQAPYEPEECQYIRCLLPGCGCDLKNGFVRDNSTNMCIPELDCPMNVDDQGNYDDDQCY